MAKISKIISSGYRHTKAISKTATREVIEVGKFPRAIKSSYQTAKRLSQIKKKSPLKKIEAIGVSIMRNGVVPHLPGLLAGIGTALPVLGSSVAGLAIGKFLQKILKKI